MKIIYKILFLFALAVFTTSCDDDTALATISSDANTGAAQFSATSIVLDRNDEEGDALTINFNDTDLGVNASKNYQLLFDLAGGDFSSPIVKGLGSETSIVYTTDEINKILINLGATPNEATEIDVKVETVLSTQSSLFSEISTLNITPYATTLDLSSIWGLVGSATVNGWDGPDMPFYKTDTDNEFVTYVSLVEGEIKIRSNNAWDVNYGDGDLDGVLDGLDDNNIAVSAGTYKILFNVSTLAYSMESFSWGLVGSATPNAWDGPDLNLEYDSYSDQWRALVTLAEGEIKIRSNNSWTTAYGDSAPDGVLDQDDDNNIAVTAGNYLVTVNFNDLTYSMVETDIWGVVGSATPNGWDGPDTKFSLDFSKENYWVLNGIELIDGEIKIRSNDSWDVNYGDGNADNVLDGLDNNNIAVTAGVYNITLDFTDPDSIVYTIE